MIVRPAAVSAATRVARKGFTLVELLAVMAIIMVLAGLGAFAVVGQMQKAKVNEAYIKMGKIEQAAKEYYISAGSVWPTSVMDLVQPLPDGSSPIMEGGVMAVTDPWQQQFQITVQNDEAGSERLVVTTINPKTGLQLTWPRN